MTSKNSSNHHKSRKSSKKHGKKTKKQKSHSSSKSVTDDARFQHMHHDPKFLPIYSKTKVADPRMHKLFHKDFQMAQTMSSAASSKSNADILKRELLEEMYDFRNEGERIRVEDMMDKMAAQHAPDSDDDDEEELLQTVHAKNFDDDTLRKSMVRAEFSDDEETKSTTTTTKKKSKKKRKKSKEPSAGENALEADSALDAEEPHLRAIREATERQLEKESKQLLQVPTMRSGEETCRLSVMNFDWQLIKTPDLFVIFNSFCPEGGSIKKISIYLSKFGKEQLEKEERMGPGDVFLSEEEYQKNMQEKKKFYQEKQKRKEERLVVRDSYKKKAARRLADLNAQTDEIQTDDYDSNYLNEEKVREYERKRLQYYFGVVECDSVETAIQLYETLDGFEVEATGVVMDIRFIPDHVSFEGRETLDRPLSRQPKTYQDKKNMESKSLAGTNVKLTWDESDPVRSKALKRNDFTDQDYFTLNQYLASESDSESESEDEETRRRNRKEKRKLFKQMLKKSKKRSVVHHAKTEEAEMEEVEITFDADAEEKAKAYQKAVQEKERLANESAWQTKERLRKEKKKKEKIERKKRFKQMELEAIEKMAEGPDESTKEQLKELVSNPHDPNADMKGFNIRRDIDREMTRRKLKQKGRTEDEKDNFELNVSDSRFANRLLADPEFTLDPTNKKFKRNKNYEKIIEAKEEMRKRKRKKSSSKRGSKKRRLE